MFIRRKNRANGKTAVQIVESHRKGNKVCQKIVRHIGQGENEREIQELEKLANSIIIELENQRQPVLPLFKPEEIYTTYKKVPVEDRVDLNNFREEQRVIDGFMDVFGKLYSDLGLDSIIGGTNKDSQWNEILKNCSIARIANPGSKRQTASFLEQDFGIKTPLDKIYRTMDHVATHEDTIKQKIADTTLNLFNNKVDVLFFDITTLYFESFTPDDLRNNGFSKDCKFKETQVVLALIATSEGIPITYKLYPGNTYEGNTLTDMVREIKKVYNVSNVMLVADRAMFNKTNLELMDSEGISYIVAAKLKSLPELIKDQIVGDDYKATVVNDEIHWIRELSHDSRRLIVSYSTRRAKKDASDRQKLIDRLLKKVKNNKINIRDLITNHGTKKYIRIDNNQAIVNTDKIENDSLWDGLHGVITNVKDKKCEEIIEKYRGLWQIEEAFRVNKNDMKMRPIFHWTEDRIHAHISICFIGYTLLKQAMHRIKVQYQPMSIDQIKNELAHAQSSILIDTSNKKRYCIPSKVTVNQKRIYHVFGLKRSEIPHQLVK